MNRSFDPVSGYLMLHHVIDWEQAVREAHRVLRRGGQSLGCDLDDTFAARASHVVDRSPHCLIKPYDFDFDLRTVGYADVSFKRSLGRQLFRFTATRP